MKQLLPNVFTLEGMLVGRVYLIKDSDGVTLIDAAVPPAGPRILKELASAGYQPSDLKRILLTHVHPDHVGGLHVLLEAAPHAQLMCHALEKPVVEGDQEIVRPQRTIRPPATRLKPLPVPVARTLADGDILPEVLGGLQVLWTPGHAPGHLSFWQPELGLLFCGDTMFHLMGITLPLAALTADMTQNIESIKREVALNPKVVCFGHGPIITEDAAGKLRRFAARFG